MRQLWLSVTAILAIFFVAHARAQIAIPDAVAAGTGCPASTSLIGITADGLKIVALFDAYTVSITRGSEKASARKGCTLAIPVNIPKNTQLVVKEVSMQNDLSLPKGAKSVFTAEVFFAGHDGVKATDTVKGPINRVRTAKKRISVVSECGKDQLLRVNSALLAEAEAGRSAFSAVRDKIELKLEWRRCR